MITLKFNKNYVIAAIILFLIEVGIAITLKSGFIRHTFGDILASIFVYCLIMGFINTSIKTAASWSLYISFIVEFLQLTPFLKMLGLGENLIAKIVFGTSFRLSDLAAYAVGIILVLLIENKGFNFISTTLKPYIISKKRLLKIGALIITGLIILPNVIVAKTAENCTFYNHKTIPKNKFGLVLGAGKFTKSGAINPYYWNRVKATVKLFKANKIDYILASGDNGVEHYDEPTTFKNDLIAMGIPANRIVLDYAGFRTLDSVVRAKKVFGLNSFTVISQRFHNQRAIYLAEKHGIKAIGFNAKHIIKKGFFNKPIREYLARIKAVIDIVINKQPKFLGEKITIGKL